MLNTLVIDKKNSQQLCFVFYIGLDWEISFKRDSKGGVMASMLSLSVILFGFWPWSGEIKDNKIGICCFSWLGRNQDNASELRWEVLVRFVDIGGIDDHHSLNLPFIIIIILSNVTWSGHDIAENYSFSFTQSLIQRLILL